MGTEVSDGDIQAARQRLVAGSDSSEGHILIQSKTFEKKTDAEIWARKG
jgi:hypothetical protein